MLLYGYFYCQLYERDPSGGKKKRNKLHIFLESNRAEETASCDYCPVPPFLLALLISRLLSYVIILQFSLMCWPYSYFLLGQKKSSSIFFSLEEVHSLYSPAIIWCL